MVVLLDRERFSYHEERCAHDGEDIQRGKGMRTGVCLGVHQLYNV